ncbi:hypothetical protein F5Y09DRAFT_351415 [Xylaria sp. FL1042]|nr:hypothetical protein F5Y09DRAFT_351415 [Xylaria sp. FL1042]
MSFGVSFGDVVLASTLAWRVYKACKDSDESFRRLSGEVASLHFVLKETEDYLGEFYDLDVSLSNVTLLTAFNSSLINSSTIRMEKRLNKLFCEVRAGHREGSVVTTPGVAETIGSPDIWQQLRRELEDVEISPVVVEENYEYIAQSIKAALAQGLMDEEDPTEVDRPRHLPMLADSGYGGSPVFSPAVLAVAHKEFEEEFREKQTNRLILKPPIIDVVDPSTRKRSLTDPTRLIKKVIRKEHGHNRGSKRW